MQTFWRGLRFWISAMVTWRALWGSWSLLAAALVVTLGPLELFISSPRWQLVIRGMAWVLFVVFGLVYAAGREVEKIERDFYAYHPSARADLAYRTFRRLLRRGDALWLEPLEWKRQWDLEVQRALLEFCHPRRREMYFTETRRVGPDTTDRLGLGDAALPEDGLGPAQDHLRRLLEDLEEDFTKWLKQ